MKCLSYFVMIGLFISIGCKQKHPSSEEYPFPQQSSKDNTEIAALLSSFPWIGVYRPERTVFIIGETHSRHHQSLAVMGNMNLIYQKYGKHVELYSEGIIKGTSLSYTISESGSQLRIQGVEKILRTFPEESLPAKDEAEARAFRLFQKEGYSARNAPETENAKRFISALAKERIDTGILKRYYRGIIGPLDDDIAEIVRSSSPEVITIIICGNLHAVNLQRKDIAANVIKLHDKTTDERTILRRSMYRYLNM